MTESTNSPMTVGEVARLLGLTVRTLHHYDRIGLCVPSERSFAGYRLYTADDLQRLQQVVVYRRLEVPLDTIAELLESGDTATHLARQREAVMARMEELTELIQAIDDTLEKTMNDQDMTAEDMKKLFGDGFEEAQAEAWERWGDTDEWKESQRRTKSYRKDDWQRIKAEGDKIQAALADAFKAGMRPDDSRATELVEAHRQHISRWFYDCSKQMQVGLGEMYVSDPRFTAAYDETYAAPGLAEWVRDAIEVNAAR